MLLEVKNLTVHYYTAMVLNEASFSVAAGELVAVVGPNGAGKTTLLRAIARTDEVAKRYHAGNEDDAQQHRNQGRSPF